MGCPTRVSHHLICFNYEPAFLMGQGPPPKSPMEKPMGFEGILPGKSQERRPRSSMMRVFEQHIFLFLGCFFRSGRSDQHALLKECWKVGRTEIVKLVKVHCISSLDFEGLEVFKSLATGINFVWTLQGVPNAWCSHSPVDLIDS